MTTVDLEAEISSAAPRVRSPGRVVFNERQLYYEVCRGLRPPSSPAAPAETSPAEVAPADFRAALAEFGYPPGLLPEDTRAPLPLAGREPDLTAYGVPRVLLCQDAAIAAMLQANGFHLEVACAVLAFPQPVPLPSPLRGMVKLARRATVFALHDASIAGLRWTAECARLSHLPRGAIFRPVGLRPAQAMRLRLPAVRMTPVELTLPEALTAAERAWLAAGWSAEVAAIHPVRLLRSLRRIVRGTIPPSAPELARPAAGYMTWP